MTTLRRVVSVLASTAITVTTLTIMSGGVEAGASPAPRAATTTATTTPHSIALGMDVRKSKGVTTQQAVVNGEAQIGHKFAFTRDFLLWDSPFPTSYENWLGQRGTVPMISVKPRTADGTPVKWADIAAAQPGSAIYAQMKSWADRVRDFGYPLYFTLNHEPEAAASLDFGSTSEFIAAWRRMHDLFQSEGATNAKFMWIMTSWAFQVDKSDRRYGWYWYPGDAYVDGIAADAYNWSNCRYPNGPYQSMAQTISGFMAFGAQHPSIPLWLTEFATVERNAGDKAQWLHDTQALLQQPSYRQIVGVSYFDQLQDGVSCNWPVDSSSSAVAAMSDMAQDPYFQGTVDSGATVPAATTSFVAAASSTANSATQSVAVPGAVTGGNGLVLVATAASPTSIQAPSGWQTVATKTSASMTSAVFQRVATGADAGSSVVVRYGTLTKGSLELLAYTGTDASSPVQSATAGTVENSVTSLSTPGLLAVASGQRVISYWSVRTSVDTALGPDLAARTSEPGSGGGRIVSTSADSGGSDPSPHTASVSPAAAHAITWSILLG